MYIYVTQTCKEAMCGDINGIAIRSRCCCKRVIWLQGREEGGGEGGAAAVMYWKSVLINVKIGAGDGGERERLKKGG